jgi:hypothetical protein
VREEKLGMGIVKSISGMEGMSWDGDGSVDVRHAVGPIGVKVIVERALESVIDRVCVWC